MDFKGLVNILQITQESFRQQAVQAINISVTVRNWLVGYYIAEYEQKGEDRAAYGEALLQKLAERINNEGFSYRNLKLFRTFYKVYPHLKNGILLLSGTHAYIRQSLNAQFQMLDNEPKENGQSVIAQSNEPSDVPSIPPEILITKLSFTHLVQLLPFDNAYKRLFYESECIKGNWSVRELQRQIHSLLFERAGMSSDPGKLSRLVNSKAESLIPEDIVKSHFTFEFLGLKSWELIEENDLEQALLNHLQSFLLELGYGFCFEARQKRILIGGEYYYIDLVFYHRILKCHVLIELKVEEFKHVNAGQLNAYLNYYQAEEMQPGDNPPVGILLVTDKNDALVEYATAGMNKKLFVSKYLVELPPAEKLEDYIRQELKKL